MTEHFTRSTVSAAFYCSKCEKVTQHRIDDCRKGPCLECIARNVAIICGRRHAPKYCACGREAVALCDWKVRTRESGTCDRPMCAQHSKQVAPGKHLCPEHQAAWDVWQKRHPPAQGSLFNSPEVSA